MQGPADGPSGVPGCGHCAAALLLSSGIDDPGVVQDLSGRSRGIAQAGAVLPDAGARWDDRALEITEGDRESEAGDGVSADQSPAGLSGVRSGGRMLFAGLLV